VIEMRMVLHREIPAGEEFRRQWNSLVQAMEHPEVFYTWEWACAVARVYGTSLRPLLFAAYRGEELAGVAALAADPRGEICFLASTTADYCDFVSTTADREEFVGRVMGELREMGFAEIRLANLPADSPSAAGLRALSRTSDQTSSYSMFARPAYFCAQVGLHSAEERYEVSKSAGRKLKRMTKAAAELRAATVEHGNTWEEFSEEFPEFATSHVGRFLSAGEVSNLIRRERRAFLMELAKLLSERGWLAVSALKIDGRSIAWNYGFRFAGKWFYYQPTFDVEAGRLSPGSYLLSRILQDAAADPETRTVDLGLGDEGYKQQHGRAGRKTLYVTASRSKARWIGHVCRYRIASWVKRSPGLETAARNGAAGMAWLGRKGVWGVMRDASSRMARVLSGGPEISFLEWAGTAMTPADGLRVEPVSAKLLAGAAMSCEGQSDALRYLLQGAKRMQSGGAEGFALVTAEGTAVHVCWTAAFENFEMPELGQRLREPTAGAVLLFDGWTPASQRGRGYDSQCAGRVAERMREKGKRAWGFRVAPDSTAGLERAGFVPRFTVARKKKRFFIFGGIFGGSAQLEVKPNGEPALDLYPAA
jgi:CelD/BcsL family acetyltransferase involved in cellulose biosynthesis